MSSYYYKVNLSPTVAQKEDLAKSREDQANTVPPCIYLSFNSTNKIYQNQPLRAACQLYLLNEVPNKQAIMPLDYKRLGNVSSSPLVKVNVFLEESVKDSSSTETAALDITLDKGTFALLPETPSSASSSSSSQVKVKKVQIIVCRTESDLYNICKTILNLKTLKLDKEDWTIKRVTATDRLLVDVMN